MIKVVTSVLGLRIFGMAFQLGYFMLLVRLLPMEAVGVYAAVNSFWLLAKVLGPLGSDLALMRRLPGLLETGNTSEVKAWLSTALRYLLSRLGALLLIGMIISFAAQQIGLWHPELWMLLLGALGALFYAINFQQVVILIAIGRPLLANSWETLWLPLILAAGVIILYVSDALNLGALLILQASVMFCFCLAGLWLVRRLLTSDANPEPISAASKKEFAKHSHSLLLSAGVIHLNMRMPVMVAPFLIGVQATALLETAMRIATLLGLIQFAAAQVTLPQISATCNKKRYESLQQLLIQTSWIVFIPTLLLYAGLILLGAPLIVLMTQPEYAAAYLPMLVLGIGFLINASAGPMQHLFTMSDHALLVTKISAAETFLSLLLMILLAQHGVLGLAIAVACGMVLRNGAFHLFLPRCLPVRPGVWSLQSFSELMQMVRR